MVKKGTLSQYIIPITLQYTVSAERTLVLPNKMALIILCVCRIGESFITERDV